MCICTQDWELRPCLWKSHKALDKQNSLTAHPDLLWSQAAHRESSLHYQNPDTPALQKIGNTTRSLFGCGCALIACQISVPTAFGSKSCTIHSRRTCALCSSWAASKSKARSDCPDSWADDLKGKAQRSSQSPNPGRRGRAEGCPTASCLVGTPLLQCIARRSQHSGHGAACRTQKKPQKGCQEFATRLDADLQLLPALPAVSLQIWLFETHRQAGEVNFTQPGDTKWHGCASTCRVWALTDTMIITYKSWISIKIRNIWGIITNLE